MDVLQGPILTHGPQGHDFEREFETFLGDDAASVSVSSCMAALHLAYIYLGIGPGDEVVVPAQTHVATAHAVEWVGATPVFADCEAETGNLTPDAIRAVITERTKAISVVHFLGIPCDMPGIVALADEHDLKVVEDCALAVGSRIDGRHVGLFGDAGCFSFYPVKHLTTSEGGMFISRHRSVVEQVARIRAFGVDRTHQERSVPGMYDVTMLGLNYRMGELQAALGRSQLRRIDEILSRRATNFEILRNALAGLPGVHVLDAKTGDHRNSHYCLSIVLDDALAPQRGEIVADLNSGGVGTSLYYPQPVPRMQYYRTKYALDESDFPNAAAISDRSIALPVGPHIDEDDARFIGETVADTIRRYSR